MSRVKIMIFVLIIPAIYVAAIFLTPENRIIGITHGFIDTPCANPSSGKKCVSPDPSKIAFYINAQTRATSYPPIDRNYNDYVGLGLFVSDEKVESIYENRKNGGADPNYLIGSHADTVRISYSTEDELSAHLQRLRFVPTAKYSEVSSDIAGYKKYDDTTCPATGTLINKESFPENKLRPCTTMREAIYIPAKQPDSLISCMQIISSENRLTLHTCEITTKTSLGGRVSYSIQPKHVLSGKWLEINSKVLEYINGLLIPASNGV